MFSTIIYKIFACPMKSMITFRFLWLCLLKTIHSQNQLNREETLLYERHRIIDATEKHLETIPEYLLSLTKVKKLILYKNQLTAIDERIYTLSNLKYLALGDNMITKLPTTLCRLHNLCSLCIRKNRLTCLPAKLGTLRKLHTLNISQNQLRFLPNTIGELISLRSICADANKLACLPSELCKLTNLKYANFMNNKLSHLPYNFGNLKKLAELLISNNRLVILPSSIGLCKSLRDLQADGNEIVSLPESFCDLLKLQRATFDNNNICTLPENFGRLRSLRELRLSNNNLIELPTSFDALKSLRVLMLSHNRIRTLPWSSCLYEKLEHLLLDCNHLTSLPTNIGNCKTLAQLDVTGNKLKMLPRSIQKLQRLKKLILKNNHLFELPENFGNLVNLCELDLSQNALECLPDTFVNLAELTHLDISDNNLSKLPKDVGLLSNLRIATIKANKLRKLPQTFANLKNLQHLNLNNNRLKQLRASDKTCIFNASGGCVCGLQNLRTLCLNENALIALPGCIGNFSKLVVLDASVNYINTIPINICCLKRLGFLNLSGNNIISIPADLARLTNLTQLYLDRNDIKEIPEAVVEVFAKSRRFTKLSLTKNKNLKTLGSKNFCGKEELWEKLRHKVVFDGVIEYKKLDFLKSSRAFDENITMLYSLFNDMNYFCDEVVTVNIDRNKIREQALGEFMKLSSEQHKSNRVEIKFDGEEGQDAGGLTKEFYNLMGDMFMNVKHKLFAFSSEQNTVMQPLIVTKVDADTLLAYKCLGRIMALCIVRKHTIKLKLAKFIYKYILGKRINAADLEDADPVYYKSLFSIHSTNACDLDLNFTMMIQIYDNDTNTLTYVNSELIKDGKNISVDDRNKLLYIHKTIEQKLTKNIQKQLEAIKEGIFEIIDKDLLSVFDENQLESLICGKDEINLEQWKTATEYIQLDVNGKIVVSWFWKIVEGYTYDMKRRLLYFVTGLKNVPHGGLKTFKLHVDKYKDT